MKSSKKSKDVAIKNANKLKLEVENQSFINPAVSGCLGLGPNQWIIDYYVGTIWAFAASVTCGGKLLD